MANLSCIPKFVKKEQTDIWVGETWKLMLLNSTHIPNPGTQQFVSNVVAKEIPASGPYTAGGVAIAGKVSVEHSPSAGVYNYYLDATDKIIGPGATLSYKYGILFQDTGVQATSKIRAQIEFPEEEIVTNGTSTIKWNALGIIYIS
ncbi:MAG: hypothetical protein JJE45_00505 [Prolixibacteraceae bacterium]|nr:hypothetical protein [Prolixibacteraceae bacterium]